MWFHSAQAGYHGGWYVSQTFIKKRHTAFCDWSTYSNSSL